MSRPATHEVVRPGWNPITGERKVVHPEGAVTWKQAERVAKAHGWDAGRLDDEGHAVFYRGGSKGVSASFHKGRCVLTNACAPERLLLLLADSCSCDGEPRRGPFTEWQDEITDPACAVHGEAS